ncbi:hypothetical protein CCR97_24160 [Rhodoplanes elegans]|uniref:Zinc finger CHC2-type domain-containing protein n=1 Tax=Rhodoplanes elegans TaxID=29408 RepID=A0A327KSK6_9BRAD|nr:CHC2 zinc finger domain-containing protein [Rhodoplanes elegans]MBK5961275.1 hypothetical protein [Rhodoplanes elegans]RAI41910.1 hypothetical protein CH338_01580 [Rhodoplanes elegans]
MPSFVDFQELKAKVGFDQVIQVLGLTLKKHGHQYRGCCPVHAGNDRTLVVTPPKGFYCFAKREGGDQIALVAHVRQCPPKEAAAFLAERTGTVQVPRTRNGTVPGTVPAPQQPPGTAALRPLDYLLAEHEGVQALGISPETAKEFGAGYAGKGIMRGRLAIPIHDRAGTLLAYCGRALGDQQPELTFPNNFQPEGVIFNANRATSGELHLVREPLEVLTAHQAGLENVVCFLTEGITAQQWEMLAALQDELQCDRVYF